MSAEINTPFYEEPTVVKDFHEDGAFSVLKEFEDNPKWFVKEMGYVNDSVHRNWIVTEETTSSDLPNFTFERFRDEVGRTKKILDTSISGIKNFIPENHLVFGTDSSGNHKGYIVIERVVGEDILYMHKLSPEAHQDFERFILTAVDFYEEQKSLGRGFFPDIVTFPDDEEVHEIHNLVYGSTEKEKNPQIFLVDTYPLIPIMDDTDYYFDNLKRALEKYYERTGLTPSKDIRQRLVAYGKTSFEPKQRVNLMG